MVDLRGVANFDRSRIPESKAAEFWSKFLILICFFPLSLIFLAFESEPTNEKFKKFYQEMVKIIIGISITFGSLTILYGWFPNFVSVIIIGIVGFIVASQLDNLNPGLEDNASKKLKNIVKFLAWTFAIAFVVITAINIVNLIFKLVLKILLSPFSLFQAIPEPIDALVPISIGAYLTHQYLKKH